jgi:probable F420-dependent oxidoreductase
MTLQLGVNLPQLTRYDLVKDGTAFARAAEEIGYDSLWACERLLMPLDQSGPHGLYGVPDLPWPSDYGITTDPIVALAAAVAVTDRIAIGTGVMVPPLHVPVRLAKTLASLDAASGGRLIAGLGSGWSIDEFAAVAPRPYAERGAALDEFLDIAAAVWGPDQVSYANERWSVARSRFDPKPGRRIPIYLGGNGRTVLSRIARRADGWLPTAVPPAGVAAAMSQIREMAAEHGRDPAEISCIYQVLITDTTEVPGRDRQPFTGSLAQVVEDVAALAEADVNHVYITLPLAAADLKELIDLAEQWHTAVRGAGL